jgi:outer membrane protein W
MSQFIYRIIFLLFVVAGAIRLSAQSPSSEVGVWVIDTKLAESTEGDVTGNLSIDFDEQVGYGLSFNHYWTERFSTELSSQKFSADTILDSPALPGRYFCGFGELNQQPGVIFVHGVDAGEIEVTAITAMAQLHFNRGGRFAPYVGAGVAHLSGDFELVDDPDVDSLDLESEITWAASAGLDFRITDRFFLAGEVKYIPWSAIAEDDPDGQSLDVDPLIFGVGVKMRF